MNLFVWVCLFLFWSHTQNNLTKKHVTTHQQHIQIYICLLLYFPMQSRTKYCTLITLYIYTCIFVCVVIVTITMYVSFFKYMSFIATIADQFRDLFVSIHLLGDRGWDLLLFWFKQASQAFWMAKCFGLFKEEAYTLGRLKTLWLVNC